MRKRPVIILVIVIGILLITILYFAFLRSPKVLSEGMKAVSPKTAVLFEIKNYYTFSEHLQKDNDFWSNLIVEPDFKTLNNKLVSIDSSFKQIPELNELLKNKPLLIALSVVGKSTIQPTYIIETNELTSEDNIHNYIESKVKNIGTIKSRDYQNTVIKTIKFKQKGKANLSYAFYKGLLICSPSELLLEESIRQLDNPKSIIDDSDFNKVFKTAGQHVDLNIYFQFRNISHLFEKYINPNHRKDFRNIAFFGDWAELDVNIEKQSIIFNGFTQSNDSSNNYLNIFKNQTSGSLDVSEILPENSSVILSLNLSDFDLFLEDQAQYFERKGQKSNTNLWFEAFKNKYDFDLKKALSGVVENEITLDYTQINPLGLSQNTFLIMETEGQSQTMDALTPLLENWAAKKNIEASSLSIDYQITEENATKIYQFPESDLAPQCFGRAFAHAKSNYFTFVEDYLVFGNSVKDLKQFIDAYERKTVLDNDTYFKQLQSDISSESNVFFYANIPLSKDLFKSCFSSDLDVLYNSNFKAIKKFQALVLQMNTVEGMLYSNLLLKYNPVIIEKPRTVWASKLDTNIILKPQIVVNHRNNKKEIFLQDIDNTIYLVNRTGKVLWKKQVDGKIMSKVYQIDYYRNNKLQYLFNTKDKIYIIDRISNNVENFPIELQAPATAGIAVFDYDGGRDYRFFIPCKDKKIYVYDIQGKILSGWEFGESEAYITKEIQHFRIGETDYILAADKNRIYILNRRGEEKIKLKKAIQKSINNPFYLVYKDKIPYFTSTNPNGHIFMINENGDVFEKEGLSVGENHYALISNFNDNPIFDVVYSDQGQIKILYDLKKELNYDFDGDLSPAIPFEFSAKNMKFGVSDYKNKNLYLFNGDGTIYKNFPLKGATEFSISLFNYGSNQFRLIAGSSDGFLYNYEVPQGK